MRFRLIANLAAVLLCVTQSPLNAQEVPVQATEQSVWVTLGTQAGPLADPERSQPANLLIHKGKNYLVDAGDGTAGQLAHRQVPTADVEALFISHLHFDHTGGLAALLGLRLQTNAPQPLVIYGPPGTGALVDRIVASMEPGATAGYGVPGAPQPDYRTSAVVHEVRDGDSVAIDGMQVQFRKNTHYSFEPGSDLDQTFESLSIRFDMDDRSIVYSGDTGPSTALVDLAKGADLLVTEMMDVDFTLAMVRRNRPDLPDAAAQGLIQHLRTHHLLPSDVGELARDANVGAVVVTHFEGYDPDQPEHLEYLRTIASLFDGPAVIANDMDEF